MKIRLTPEQRKLVGECIVQKTFLRALPLAKQIVDEMYSYYFYHDYPEGPLLKTTVGTITKMTERALLDLLYRNDCKVAKPLKKNAVLKYD